MTCPICGMSSSTYTGIRFPCSIRRANKFHEALSIPTWVDVGQCYICFDHFNEEDLIVDEEGVILGVRKEAVPNPQKSNPNWAKQHQIQQDARTAQFVDCPFCGLQLNGAGRFFLLQTHIEAEHGLRADVGNLRRIVLERRRRIEKRQYYTSHIQQKHQQIGEDEPGTSSSSSASATVNVIPKVIENGNVFPSIPTNMDNIEMVICTICNENVSSHKMQIHMYGVHNMGVTNLKMCLASHRSVAKIDSGKNIVEKKVAEKKSNQIGYSIHQPKMLPNSSSLMKGNQMANLKIKTEINTEDGEKELNQQKLNESSNMETSKSNESSKSPNSPPLNLFLRTLLNNSSSSSIERQNSQEEQMDWALAMTVAVAQEKKMDKKVEEKSRTGNEINAGKAVKEKEMPKNIQIPKNINLRPSTINFNPNNKNNELGQNNDGGRGMNGRAKMNYYKSNSSIIRSPPSCIPCAKDPIGKWKPLGGILSSEYIPSKRWREEITLSGIEGNNKRQKLGENVKKNLPNNEEPQCSSSKMPNIQPINPHKFICPLCHKKWILQNELRHHLIYNHNIPPNSQNLVEIERQSVIRPKKQQNEQSSSSQFIDGPNEEEPLAIRQYLHTQFPSKPKPWSVNRLLCTICEQYVQYPLFLTHLAHWHDIHLDSEEHIGLYAIAGHGEQFEKVDKSYKPFSEEEKRKIGTYKKAGHSVYWIAKQLGRPHSLVNYILNKMGIPIHSNLNEKSQEDEEKEEEEIKKILEIVREDAEQNGNEEEEDEEGDDRQQIQYHPPLNRESLKFSNPEATNRRNTIRIKKRTTKEEWQKVLKYKAQGYSNNWIAYKLGRSHTLINNIVKAMNIKTGNRQKRRRSKKVESEDDEEEEEEEMEEEETEDEQPAKRKNIRRNLVKEKSTNKDENSNHDELTLKRDKFGRNFCVFCKRPIHRRHFLIHLEKSHNVNMEEGKNGSDEDEFIQKYCIKLEPKKLATEKVVIKEEPVDQVENVEETSNAKMRKSLVNNSPTKIDKIIPKMEQMDEEEEIEMNRGNNSNNNDDHDYGCANMWIRL